MIMELDGIAEVRNYLVFILDLWRNLHLGIFRLMKECTMSYSSCERLRSGVKQTRATSYGNIRTWVLWRSNVLPRAFESDEKLLWILIALSRLGTSNEWAGTHSKPEKRGMLEKTDFRSLDYAVSTIHSRWLIRVRRTIRQHLWRGSIRGTMIFSLWRGEGCGSVHETRRTLVA